MMKSLQTQFDDKRLSNAVATPTCSSCCCCCCCLATSIASSTLLAQRVAKEGEKHQVGNRHLLTVIAALFVPLVGLLVYFGFWIINLVLRTCTDQTDIYSGSVGSEHYTVCTYPGAISIIPLLIIVPFLVLLYLYKRVHIDKPVKRAILITCLIAVAFTAEAAGGAALVVTGIGGIFYLIMVPIVVGWITVWYHKHLLKEASLPTASASSVAQSSHQTTEDHENPTTPDAPTQQGPSATSPQ